MIRFFFRVLACVALASAVVMAVLDTTRSVAASKLVLTPLAESWEATLPTSFAAFRTFVETYLAGFLWDPVLVTILAQPGFVVLAVLAFLLYLVGHRAGRERDQWARR